ncbi:hypothetical protein BJ322DRAFT_1108069 [Thelephora terrestris]|uniref:Uncharacterized protein n=1 Tax=Thelephora terrestris TaxID=56493 RepID=A0A9P6HIP9_9AGAM|nr:hypothetical protein BJ322DRAFT_1108069 [Thelephora terrestris]
MFKADVWEMPFASPSPPSGWSQPSQKLSHLSLPPHHQYLEMTFWVLLGDVQPALFLQDEVPEVELIGRRTPPFPVHIQCRSYKHAQEVSSIHDELAEMHAEGPTPMQLASSLYASHNLPKVFTDNVAWWTILNGATFKGIIHSDRHKADQTDRHPYPSFCRSFCLRDALIHIILGGDKAAFAEITAANLTLPMDRLTLTAISYHTSEEQGRERSSLSSGKSRRLDSFSKSSSSSSTSSTSTVKTPHVIERGCGPVIKPALCPQQVQTKHPPSPPIVYKYIRGAAGVVGSITDPTGVTSINYKVTENAVGGMCAKYLDAHGYGKDAIRTIADTYQSAIDMEDFVSCASGCGMLVMELEWFWEFSWCP